MSSQAPLSTSRSNSATRTNAKLKIILAAVAVVVLMILASQMGMYTVQPIGALPSGVTLIIWRASGEPLFNSPDAVCLTAQGSVSLLCRGQAISHAPADRVILRLPYMEWMSTGGKTFDR
jgi:hypothetical protein